MIIIAITLQCLFQQYYFHFDLGIATPDHWNATYEMQRSALD